MAILVLVHLYMKLKCDDEKMSHYRIIANNCPKTDKGWFHIGLVKQEKSSCRGQIPLDDGITLRPNLSPNFIGTEITASAARGPRVKEGTLSHF
jgi:hypothetical protein